MFTHLGLTPRAIEHLQLYIGLYKVPMRIVVAAGNMNVMFGQAAPEQANRGMAPCTEGSKD